VGFAKSVNTESVCSAEPSSAREGNEIVGFAFKGKRRSSLREPLPESGGATELVVELQARRLAGDMSGAKRLEGELVRVMWPLLVQSARRFEKALGSLSLEDLLQVGALEVHKAVSTFNVERARGQTFEQWTYFRARRAMKDLVGWQSADVTLTDRARRGRPEKRRGDNVTPLHVESQDRKGGEGQEHESAPVFASSILALQVADETPEDAAASAQSLERLSRALRDLPAQQRDAIARAYGIGRARQSVREISRELGVPRARIDQWLAVAVAELRSLMGEE
jgi:RNA polymerase sigma factor (sigma-70 family)